MLRGSHSGVIGNSGRPVCDAVSPSKWPTFRREVLLSSSRIRDSLWISKPCRLWQRQVKEDQSS